MHDINKHSVDREANIILTKIRISEEEKKFFIDWQANLQGIIANFPGFLSLEILAPTEGQPSWTLVQRFVNAETATAWLQSVQRKTLFKDLISVIQQKNFEDFFSAESSLHGVTEVIVTEIAPDKKKFYEEWLAKIHQAEAKLPGFLGMYVQAPSKENERYWITFLQFDTSHNLEHWLSSPERQELLKEMDPYIKSIESHRISSPYAGWFGSIAKNNPLPPVWKQTLLILLVLFPIVMLEFKFLSPFTRDFDISLATFIGNALSVFLISWPMLPIAIYCFRWWLTPQPWNQTTINLLGSFILLAIYMFEILIFWHFV